MSKLKKLKKLYIPFSLALAIIISVSAVYAIFTSLFEYNGKASTKQMDITCNKLQFNENSFEYVGQKINANLIAENSGEVPVNYALEFQTSGEKTLINAIILYIDGKEIGNLGKLINDNTYSYDIMHPLFIGASVSHTVELEYHIGASEIYKNKVFSLEVQIRATSVDVNNYAFVGTEKQLIQALKNKKMKGANIVLVGDITLSSKLVASNMANIDLYGNKLVGDIEFESDDSGVFEMFSSKGEADYVGMMSINSPNALLLFKNEIQVLSCNKELLANYYQEFLQEKTSPYISDSVSLDGVYQNYQEYLSINIFEFEYASEYLFYNSETNQIQVNKSLITRRVNIVVDIQGYEYSKQVVATVLGDNDEIALYNALTQNVYHLDFYDYENASEILSGSRPRQIITGDIFLPVQLKGNGARVVWYTSDDKIISTNGIINHNSIDSKDVTLTAIVTINNSNYLYEYYIKVSPSIDRIKSWFELEYGVLDFKKPTDFIPLPISLNKEQIGQKSGYDVEFEIESIAYDSNILTNSNESLGEYFVFSSQGEFGISWIKNTSHTLGKFAYIVTLDNGIEFGGYINMRMVSTSTIDVFQIAYDNLIANFNYDSNSLQGCSLPDSFTPEGTSFSLSYEYELIPSFIIDEKMEYKNPANIASFAKVLYDNTRFTLNPYAFPTENTICYIKLTIRLNQTTFEEFAVPFLVKGILHYDENDSLADIADFSLYTALINFQTSLGNFAYCENAENVLIEMDNLGNQIQPVIISERFITRDKLQNPPSEYNGVFSAVGLGINSIKGIEYFTSITHLDLSQNNVEDLSALANMQQLTTLIMDSNRISDVSPLKNLINLTNLWLHYNNNISDIYPLANLVKLVDFRINGNSVSNKSMIDDFSVIMNFINMRVFHCSYSLATENNYIYNENYFITTYKKVLDRYGAAYLSYKIKNNSNFTLDTTRRLISDILGSVVPSVQFADVLFLPFSVTYNNTNYTVNWSTNNASIVKIVGNTLTITQPIANTDIKLYAYINYSSITLYRVFDVRSLSDLTKTPRIYSVLQSQYVNAKEVIQDEKLLYAIFQTFDVNLDGEISLSELGNDSLPLDIANLQIRSLVGLEQFANLKTLTMNGNDIQDFTAIGSLRLTSLTTDCPSDFGLLFDALENSNLAYLHLKNANIDKILSEYLRRFLTKNPNLLLTVNNETFDPFEQVLVQALDSVENYYMLYKGQTQFDMNGSPLDLNANINSMHNYQIQSVIPRYQDDNEVYDFTLKYTRLSGSFSFGSNLISLAINPVTDNYGMIQAQISFGSSSYTKTIVVISLAEQVFIYENGEYYPLETKIPNESIREIVLNNVGFSKNADNKLYVTPDKIASYSLGRTIIVSMANGKGLEGLEYFKNLEILRISYYRNIEGQKSLVDVLSKLTSLSDLVINASILHLQELTSLPLENLNRIKFLRVRDNAYVEFQNSDGSDNLLSMLPNLRMLDVSNTNMIDFSFLEGFVDNHDCNTILSFKNVANTTKLAEYYMGRAYAKLKNQYKNYAYEGNNLGSGQTNNPITPTSNGYSYYMYSNTVKYTPTKEGNINLTYGGTDGVDKIANPTMAYANYLTTNEKIILPITTDKGFPIKWTSSCAAIEISETNHQVITTISQTVARTYKYSYVWLKAEITSLEISYKYYFVIENNGYYEGTSETLVDIEAFMSDGKFYDANFANTLLSAMCNGTDYILGSTPRTSTYMQNGTIKFDTSITTIVLDSHINQGIKSIEGIQQFASHLEKLVIINQGLVELNPIASLTKLTYLDLSYNPITTLFDKTSGNSYFRNLTNLNTLKLIGNTSINNYLPIVYSNLSNPSTVTNSANKRTGLNKLTSVNLRHSENEQGQAISTTNFLDNSVKVYGNFTTKQTQDEMLSVWQSSGASNYNYYLYDGFSNGTTSGHIDSYLQLQNWSYNNYFTAAPFNINAVGTDEIDLLSNIKPSANSNFSIAFSSNYIINDIDGAFVLTSGGTKLKVLITSKVNIEFELNIRVWLDNRHTVVAKVKITLAMPAQYIQITQGVNANAAIYIPDENLRNRLFEVFDTNSRDGIITYNERHLSLETVTANILDIKNIKGIEYFPGVISWELVGNPLNSFPEFDYDSSKVNYYKIQKLNLSGSMARISDYSNLTALAPYLVYLNVSESTTNECGLNESIFTALSDFSKLQTLVMQNNKLSNYEGLLSLPRNLYAVDLAYSQSLNLASNVDYIRQFVLGSQYKTYNYTNTPSDSAFSEYFVYEMMNYLTAYPQGVTSQLPYLFTINGVTYTVKYYAHSDSGAYYTIVDTNRITIKTGTIPKELKLKLGVVSSNDTTIIAYEEVITLLVGSGATQGSIASITDGLVEFDLDNASFYAENFGIDILSADLIENKYLRLSKIVIDEALRMYFFKSIDTDKDSMISLSELMATTFNIEGSEVVTDFSGINLFTNITTLGAKNYNTRYIEPISKLTTLTSLNLTSSPNTGNMVDLSCLARLENLTSLTIDSVNFIDLNFATHLTKLTYIKLTVSSMTEQNRKDYAVFLDANFVRVTAGYLNITINGKNFADFLNKPTSITEYEKLASAVFKSYVPFEYVYDLNIDSVFEYQLNEGEYTLNQIAFYNGKEYHIEFETLSPCIEINQNKLTLSKIGNREKSSFLAKVEINGKLYENKVNINIKEL